MTKSTQPVIVIGAGVIGLSTARTIQQRHPQANITIIAAELPSIPSTWTSAGRPSADYASMWAGAHYRPIPRSTRQLDEEADMAQKTAEIMYQIADESPEAGVARMPAQEFLENPPPAFLTLKTGDLYAGPNDNFRIFDQSELPKGSKWGCEYQSYCVNVPLYCSWLLQVFLANGGKVVQKSLDFIEEAFLEPDVESTTLVVNCSGRNFDTDPDTKPIRGQTVLVRNEYHLTITKQTKEGGWVAIIPRPGGAGTIVGVTKEIGDMDPEPRLESRQKLLQACVESFPDFVDDVSKFDVILDNVGRRPWREGGIRIETESLPGDRKIIHGYGTGGRGYELSWGAAMQIADLYDQSL